MSIIILLCLLASSLILLLKKHARKSFFLVTLALIYTLSIATSLVPKLLVDKLEFSIKSNKNITWKKNNIIILLGGGITHVTGTSLYLPEMGAYARIFKAAELYFSCRKQGQHCRILISGGPIQYTEKSEALVYEKILMRLDIPQDDFILELQGNDTQTNAQYTATILQTMSYDKLVLVTSGLHMKRALLWFAHFGLYPQAIAADQINVTPFFKSLGENFYLTDNAIHEYLGIAEVYFYDFFKV